eukprot:scaffold24925_cov66-Phaeocystis_antarctica.AAC.5
MWVSRQASRYHALCLACYTVPQDSSIPASALACTCWHIDLLTYADLALDSPTGERRRAAQSASPGRAATSRHRTRPFRRPPPGGAASIWLGLARARLGLGLGPGPGLGLGLEPS